MNRQPLAVWLSLLAVLAAMVTSCLPGPGEPQGQLVFLGPLEQGIAAGDFVPGTTIQYVGLRGANAELLIDGQRAEKKKGDSLDWDGHPLEGVVLNLRQRIIWFTAEKLHAAGTARLSFEDVEPVEGGFPESAPAMYRLPTTYNVKTGQTIPGTTISYVGSTDAGAELGGIDGYPYRRVADSIAWEGRLRQGVFLQTTLRVVFYDDLQLQVAGLATIALVP